MLQFQTFTSLSLSNGIDYGLLHIYSNILHKLSLIAKMVISPVILYSSVLKLSNGNGQFGLKGNMIAMENDSVNILNKVLLLLPNLENIPFSIMWTGNLDKLKRIKSNGRNDFVTTYGNIFHINIKELIQWIDYIQYKHSYLNIKRNYDITEDKLQQFIDKFIDNIHVCTDLSNLIDVQVDMNIDGASDIKHKDGEEGNFSSYLVHIEEPTYKNVDEIKHREIILNQAYKSMYPNNNNESNINDKYQNNNSEEKTNDFNKKEDNNTHNIQYFKDPINEYTNMKDIFDGAFPFLFIWGYPFEQTMIKSHQIKHMLHQSSNLFSNNFDIVSYLHNIQRRKMTAYGVNYAFRNDAEAVSQFRIAYEDPNFHDTLKYCIRNPKTEQAKEIEAWLAKLITKSVQNVQFSGAGGSIAVSNMIALTRFFSNGQIFLTGAPRSELYGLFYRY